MTRRDRSGPMDPLTRPPPAAEGSSSSRRSQRAENDETEEVEVDEYEVGDVCERMESSRGSRLRLLTLEFAWGKMGRGGFMKPFPEKFIIHPDNRWYQIWKHFILIWAVYSSFFTPFEFGFFRGLPRNLFLLDICSQIAFLVDIVVHFLLAYRDTHTYRMIHDPNHIALRYLKGSFFIDLIGCLPWDTIYAACGRKEEVRYILWIRLSRVRKVTDFFQKLEKDIRINYLFTRILKLIAVELYCTHTAACIFYYLATTLPPSMEGYTWIGSLKLGDYSYEGFREIDLFRRYVTSLYFAIITMATVGYGDIHAVNVREMIFIMIFVSFDMILGAYLIGNMTALIVKGSNTERFRDKMTDLIKYMNRNRLGKGLRDQIKGHVRLQYESQYTKASVLEDIPISIRAKISESLYKPYIENVPLFKGCSSDFIDEIVIRLQEEFFLPGEVIMEQGSVVHQLYFVCSGSLEAIGLEDDRDEETLKLEADSSFGEIAIIFNIPQPTTVRVTELCRLLLIDKQSFTDLLETYFSDGRIILKNLVEVNESKALAKQLETDATFHIGKHEAELALKLNSAAYHGDLHHLKGLIRSGADPNLTDYDGRTPLHLAASRGYESITRFLIHEGVDVDKSDKFGNTPLSEAIENGHDRVASLLVQNGATLNIGADAGCRLCSAVARGDKDFIKRVLSLGFDPDVRDYDSRTPLHIAAAEGLFVTVKTLVEAGANVLVEDRWGNTPLDEARRSGSEPVIKLLEQATSSKLSHEATTSSHEIVNKERTHHCRRCTVYPFHPWEPKEQRKEGIVLWVPNTIEELINSTQRHLDCSGTRILSEDGGRIIDVDMISNGEKLYLVTECTKQ